MPRTRLIQSTLRCLDVLDALAEYAGPVSISELARRIGAQRGTVHQQLQTLVHAGWARQTAEAKYYLSLRAVHIGKAALAQAGIADRKDHIIAGAQMQLIVERLLEVERLSTDGQFSPVQHGFTRMGAEVDDHGFELAAIRSNARNLGA